MKNLLYVLLSCVTLNAFADNGDITITNGNSQFSNQDAIAVQIVPTGSSGAQSFYAKNIAATAPNNQKTLTSDDFENVQKFDVYIADISQSGTYRRCLKGMSYSETEAAATLAVTNTDEKPSYNQCSCTYQGSTYPCEYPVTTYRQVRGSANIPW